MSQYVSFFIRKDNDFIQIKRASSNSKAYELFKNCLKWEKIVPINDYLESRWDIAGQKMAECYKDMQKIYAEKQLVPTYNNSIEEKQNYLFELDERLDEYKDEYDEWAMALEFVRILYSVAENNYTVYAGLECSCPTINDIAE